jgi:serine/threonine protein kinase/Flp pilus assembly protein TadD
MTARELERFRHIEALFDAALEYPMGIERDRFLAEQRALDPELDAGMVERVHKLLAGHERVCAAPPATPEELPQFGPWQAIRVVGRGGMGTIYLAERADGAFKMSAAVKVVPLALASVDIEERFRRERQFLASLDHPKVARLIDGGVTGLGLPYLVMEFVDGLAIDRYCDSLELDRRARIALMRQVLEALIYVHGQQVIHRDLKASNIIVDAAGNAKLLDFGTARLVDAGGDIAITKTGVFAFTPECASPEQVQGKPLTFASDIYSAGVLLYRLLTDRHPYRLTEYSPAAVAHTISTTDPDPSGLEGPLDAILSTALSKNPEQRYASAAEMDADLARYLEGQRVWARRPRKIGRNAGIAAISIVCAMAAWVSFGRDKVDSAVPMTPSIAVLPFTNVNDDPSDQYLVDGLTEEVRGDLARLKSLRVASASAAAVYRNPTRDIRAIGGKIKVSYFLEASLERSVNRIKLVASLERASDGARLWTNTYQRQTADLNVIETDLEARISASLGISAPSPATKHAPPELAHEYYLKACFEADQISLEANDLAQQNFRRALNLDPDYALAYAGLGAAIWNRSNAAGQPFVPAKIRESEELWQKAMQLDPGLAKAHVALAMFAMRYDWDWDRAERDLQAALSINPTAGAEMNFASLDLILGRRADADRHFQRAQDLDPLSSQAVLNAAQFLALESRFSEAREEIWKIASQNPTSTRLQIRLNFLDAWLSRPGVALENLRKASRGQPFARELLAKVEARDGRRTEALKTIGPLEQNYQDGHLVLTWAAEVYALLDDEPSTVKWLERAIDVREDQAAYIHVDPAFAKMQNTAAFHALKMRMNLDW